MKSEGQRGRIGYLDGLKGIMAIVVMFTDYILALMVKSIQK